MSRKAKDNPIIQHKQRTEAFKRPSHYDFMTTEELKKTQFTGLRNNQVALCTEIWVLGVLKASVPFSAAVSVLEDKYKEIFGFHIDTKLIGPTTNPRGK